MKKTSELILHPVRMQIIQTLIGGKQLTVQDMLTELNEVPQATLYRHLKKLVDARFIQVIATRQIRGSQEKIYALKSEEEIFNTDEGIDTAKEEQMRVFMQKTGGIMDQYGKSLNNIIENPINNRDMYFETQDLYMSEEEVEVFIKEVNKIIKKHKFAEPQGNRQRTKLSTIIFPTQDV